MIIKTKPLIRNLTSTLRLTSFALIFKTMQLVFFSVPTIYWEAKAGATDRNIRPAANPASFEELGYSGLLGNEPPTTIGLLANQCKPHARMAVTKRPILHNHGIRIAVAIQVAYRFNPGAAVVRGVMAKNPYALALNCACY